MDNGFVGNMNHLPEGYRCYLVFLPNETNLPTKAEEYVMRSFWEFSSSVGNEVLFTGFVKGNGLEEVRRLLEINKETEAYLVLLDIPPQKWTKEGDPLVKIPINKLHTEYEILELLHLLVTVTKKVNFIGSMKRELTFQNAKKILKYVPKIGELIEFIL